MQQHLIEQAVHMYMALLLQRLSNKVNQINTAGQLLKFAYNQAILNPPTGKGPWSQPVDSYSITSCMGSSQGNKSVRRAESFNLWSLPRVPTWSSSLAIS